MNFAFHFFCLYDRIKVVCNFMLKSRRKDENIMKILIQNGHVLDPESKTEGDI